ncbi:unnamed protein product [Parnassius apollo]|uniref:(apollo) hypothetical protein n=1 Tax=Parnassius apollo TaxID=110799 RepID=A0A8S3YAF1_PARAO|nr:unnamed protein product [Parnassius apollo]
MEEYISIDEFDCGESSSTTEVQNSEAGNSASQATLENSNPATKSKVVQKRRAKNPPELQEASKQMSAAFNTLNSVLQTKKNTADKENDDADLFCKLLAKQLKDFPKDEREEIMYEIHGLILNKRRHCRGRDFHPIISPSIYNRSSSAHSSSYSHESLPRNIISPDSPIFQQSSFYSDTSPHIIINRPSSSRSSYTIPTPPQNFNQERSHQTLPVDQQPTLYCYTSPSQMLINRPSSSRSSYITPTLPQNFNQEISHESPHNVRILSQETLQLRKNNTLQEAFEKATTEQE